MQLDDRIARYVDTIPGAVSGSRGHDQTFTVAVALIWGFALDSAAALKWMGVYNARCSPPWKDRELRHKVSQAEKTAHEKPRGYLLGAGGAQQDGAWGGETAAGRRGPKLCPVVRRPEKPEKGGLRTLRTLFPDIRVTRTQARAGVHTASMGEIPSEASETGNQRVRSMSAGIPVHLLDWTAINAEFPPTEDEKNWQAVVDSGFGDEPLILAAFTMFGPGCMVLETGRTTPCE